MKKRIFYVILGVTLAGSLFTGCGKEGTKEKGNTVKIELSSDEEEVETSETDESTTLENGEATEQTTTAKQEEETSQKQENTTTKQETTTKKQETTTKKRETTTKKQETTTKKQETTTKKQETTTKKQEQTTTKKQETTTTAAPKTWFEQKGYKITPRSQVTDLGNVADETHDCGWEIKMYEGKSDWLIQGGKEVCVEREGWCDVCDLYTLAFDRYTGIVYSYSSRDDEFNVKFSVNGKLVTCQPSGDYGVGSDGVTLVDSIICQGDYDGVVFMIARDKDVTENEELVFGAKLYTLDEVVQFDPEDCYFLSVDEK